MGVRTNVPFSALTSEEREIVFYGPAEKKHILYRPKKSDTNDFAELDLSYFNAVYTVAACNAHWGSGGRQGGNT